MLSASGCQFNLTAASGVEAVIMTERRGGCLWLTSRTETIVKATTHAHTHTRTHARTHAHAHAREEEWICEAQSPFRAPVRPHQWFSIFIFNAKAPEMFIVTIGQTPGITIFSVLFLINQRY